MIKWSYSLGATGLQHGLQPVFGFQISSFGSGRYYLRDSLYDGIDRGRVVRVPVQGKAWLFLSAVHFMPPRCTNWRNMLTVGVITWYCPYWNNRGN